MFNIGAWLKCSDTSLKIDRVGGGAGLDLAASEDWAALALCWEEGEDLRLWVNMWVTEEWCHDNVHHGEFTKWAQQGHLTMMEGNCLDYDRLVLEATDILRKAKTRCLGFDRMFAHHVAQTLEKKVPRMTSYGMAQSVAAYAQPCAELKNAVRTGTLRHIGNPALDWQAGHVMVHAIGDLEKPIRDPEVSWKKVDGIQACCMAIRARLEVPELIKLNSAMV
jgi:phage terminase large subunit-like protein